MTPATYIAIAMAAVVVILIIALLIDTMLSRGNHRVETAGVSINASDGSVVTVRKIGRTTRVDIRDDVHDHWEGSGAIAIKPVGIELTRQLEPELFAEYMSVETSATRKYEIADYIYSIGLSLPYIRGLNEKWRDEQAAMAAGNPALEHTPVNPHGGQMVKGIVYKTLEINRDLQAEPMEDLDEVPKEETHEEGTE